MWPTFLLGGCVVGLDPIPSLDANGETGASARDSVANEEDEPTSTAPPSERTDIWIYTGHGGVEATTPTGSGGVESIQAHWTMEGWNTTVMSDLPDLAEMDRPRLLVLAAPGSSNQIRFEPLDVRKLELFLESDGLLALYIDECTNPHINTLLSTIGLDIQLSPDSEQTAPIVRDADIDDASTLVSGIESITLMEPCQLIVRSGTSLVFSDRTTGTEVYVASGRPDVGGEAIVLGDFQLIDDSGYLAEADNKALASRLAARTPETVR